MTDDERNEKLLQLFKKLPKLTVALASISKGGGLPEQAWQTIDKGLADKLLQIAGSALRPLDTNRGQTLPKRHLR